MGSVFRRVGSSATGEEGGKWPGEIGCIATIQLAFTASLTVQCFHITTYTTLYISESACNIKKREAEFIDTHTN